MNTTSAIADPDLLAVGAKRRHGWYANWFVMFGVASFVMAALVHLLDTPLSWIVPIVIAAAMIIWLLTWVRKWPEIVVEHRRTTATFFIGWLILWAITCPLALSGNRGWIFYLGGAAMLTLAVFTASRIRTAGNRSVDADYRVH